MSSSSSQCRTSHTVSSRNRITFADSPAAKYRGCIHHGISIYATVLSASAMSPRDTRRRREYPRHRKRS